YRASKRTAAGRQAGRRTTMKKRITTIAVLAASAVLATTGIASAASSQPQGRQSENIVQVASGAPQFSTLVSLIKKAGLVKTLSGPGPFTVLAPTNAAFNRVPKKTLDAIASDKAILTKVLTYHVIAGKAMAADVVKLNGKKVKTVEGEKVSITVRNGKVFVNKNAKVITTDIAASNGVIHAINNVLVPPSVLAELSH
ncbi:MAG: fasciclin domain-containing protein, partial [Gaiellales bacterium]